MRMSFSKHAINWLETRVTVFARNGLVAIDYTELKTAVFVYASTPEQKFVST